MDCIDGDIPVSAIITSASLHDSQAAIPLAQMSSERVANLYDLMDVAYDSPEIHAFISKSLKHRPIIDNNPRRGEKILMDPATKSRFAERSPDAGTETGVSEIIPRATPIPKKTVGYRPYSRKTYRSFYFHP